MASSTKHAAEPFMPQSLAWALEYLPNYFINRPAPFHAELFGDLETSESRLLARVAPRGHAKSTCAALAYPLWCICEGRKNNIAIITHEASLATQFVRDIRNELECNDDLIAAYGDLSDPKQTRSVPIRAQSASDGSSASKPAKSQSRTPAKKAKWTDTLLTTSTGVTIQAKGSGAGFRGTRVGPNHPDLIICDDIEKDELVESPRQRKKLEHWLRRVVMPALAPGGQLLVLGSIIHYDSLLANLRDRTVWPRWNYRVYRALEAETGDDGKFYSTALWPDRWPVDQLHIERERVGTIAFEQEYQANPIDDSIRTFRPEWLQRYDCGTAVSAVVRFAEVSFQCSGWAKKSTIQPGHKAGPSDLRVRRGLSRLHASSLRKRRMLRCFLTASLDPDLLARPARPARQGQDLHRRYKSRPHF